MLKQRLLTIAALLPFVVAGILVLPNEWFAIICGLIILVAAWEWATLMGLLSYKQYAYVALMACLLPTSRFLPINLVLSVAVCGWLLNIFWVLTYPKNRQWSQPILFAALGALVLVPSWLALITMHDVYGPSMLLLMLALVWGADCGAYATGKCIGRTKLLPVVSPGKTVEGVVGGVLFGTFCFALVTWLSALTVTSWPAWGLLAFVCAIVSVFGDLLISVLKRFQGVKDSGVLLPGHGGFLDRIDSVTAVAPCFLLALLHGNFTK